MKRIALLTVLLLAVSLTAAFAIDVKPTVAITGSASVAWGLDLDNNTSGFVNTPAASFTLNLLPADGTDTHAGKGAVYGSITIANIEFYWTDAGVPTAFGPAAADVSAKLVVAPFEIGINAAPAMGVDSGAIIEDVTATPTGNAIIDAILEDDTSFAFSTYASGHGTWIKYVGTGFSVAVDVTSNGGYTGAGSNTANGYAAGVEGSVTFAPVTVNVGLFQGFNWGTNPLGGYASAALDLTGIGTAGVGFDWSLAGTTFTWEISANAQMNFNEAKTAYLLAKLYYDPIATGKGLDSVITLMLPAKTLLGAANFDVSAYLLDLNQTKMAIGVIANAGYMMALEGDMYVQPTINASFSTQNAVSHLTLTPAVVLGLAAAPAATLTFGWTSGDLLVTPVGMGSLALTLAVTY
jgi:hypothetical protein